MRTKASAANSSVSCAASTSPSSKQMPSSTISRALSLVQVRLGRNAKVGQYLKPHFPDADDLVNRELARLLIAADEPSAVPTAVKLMTPSGTSMNSAAKRCSRRISTVNTERSYWLSRRRPADLPDEADAPADLSDAQTLLLLYQRQVRLDGDLRVQYGAWLTNAQNQFKGEGAPSTQLCRLHQPSKVIRRDAIQAVR